MLHFIAVFSAATVILTGLYVLGRGNWHSFGLKFAGVAISTTAATWLLGAEIVFGGGILSCPATMSATVCMTLELYHIARNLAFIIFHIAIGRDAIHFKQRERRGTLCRTNSSKQPLPS